MRILPILFIISTRIVQTISLANNLYINHQPLSVKNLIHGIKDNQFDKIYFSENMRKVSVSSPNYNVIYDTTITPLITEKLVETSLQHNVEPIFADYNPNSIANVFNNLFFPVVIFLLFRSMLSYTSNMMGGSSTNMFNIGNPPARNKENTNVTFADWSGSKEVLNECIEFVSYMKNDTFYKQVGAQLPRGILLEGPPGTGKTLLAKAIATESNSSFISISGSEFIEMFVGVGALRVRRLFEEARKNQPSIVFIDEIDAIGRQRGQNNIMGGNDEREQTLNQLLTEMDGFNKNDGIIVIAATNRMDILDEALLRPGRFDRIVKIPLPDTNSRKEILTAYLKKKKVDETININALTKLTTGFSGAKLKNLVNEASIMAARKRKTVITNADMLESLEKMTIGIKKTVDTRDAATLKRVALHEAGHGFIVQHFSDSFDLLKITIQATYSGAGGFTIFSEKYEMAESRLYTKDLFMKRLMIALGGKAAEALFYGDDYVSLGATMDLKQANQLARNMIEQYGMGNQLQVFFKENDYRKSYSEMTEAQIDKEVADLVNEAYFKAKQLLESNRDLVKEISYVLLDKVTLTGGKVQEMMLEYSKKPPTDPNHPSEYFRSVL